MSRADKNELKLLLEKYLIGERRQEIYLKYRESFKELKKGALGFTCGEKNLRKMLEG